MIKVEVIEKFTLKDFNKLKNVKKVVKRKDNEFDAKDTFECDEEMADYLTGNNPLGKVVVKIIEVEPKEITEEEVQAVADAIVEVAEEDNKSVEEVVKEIKKDSKIICEDEEVEKLFEEKPKKKKGKK